MDRPPVHTVTALKSLENSAKLKWNAFQFENLKYLGPININVKVKTHLLILSIMSTSKMILSDRGLNRRIQEMGLGNNIIKGFFS